VMMRADIRRRRRQKRVARERGWVVQLPRPLVRRYSLRRVQRDRDGEGCLL
jgi:hypothetical protein